MTTTQPKDHLDNDKDLNNILANLAWSGKYFDSGQEVLNAFAVKEAKDLIDQYTQSKLEAFAGEVLETIESEYQKCSTVGRVNDEGYTKLYVQSEYRSNLREALKAIKGKAGIE